MAKLVTHTFRTKDQPFYVVMPKDEDYRPRMALDCNATADDGYRVVSLNNERGLVSLERDGRRHSFVVRGPMLRHYRDAGIIGAYVKVSDGRVEWPRVMRLNWTDMTAEAV